jgi:hypothetical protein
LVGAAGGWALSEYSGSALWLPGGSALLLVFLFSKTSFRPKYFVGAISVTGGHVAAFLVASILLRNWWVAAPDIVLLSLGIVFLWLKPGLVSALSLGVLQLASLVLNLFQILQATVGSFEHRSLTAHCAWRLLALVCLGVGYLKLRKDEATASVPPPLPTVA